MQKLINIHDLLPIPAESTDSSTSLTPNTGDISSLTEDELIENEEINIRGHCKGTRNEASVACHIT